MPWREQWKELDEIEPGGQGIVTELRGKQYPEKRAVLKQIAPRWKNNPQAIERLKKEIETLTKLKELGARVPAVYDSFINHNNSEPFLLMEYIEGIRFDKWLKMTAPVPTSDAVEVTLSIAETIQKCHEHKIGHRDLKPTNIILKNKSTKEPYIIDFGISFDSHQTVALTREGEMFWNEFLILPECQDLEGGHRDLRSDITALVGIFYSCITGKSPIVLMDAQERLPHKRQNEGSIFPRADSPDQAEQLMWFFDKGFSYRVDARFQTLDEFVREISQFKVSSDEIPLNLVEQFGLFDQTLRTQERSVQLAQLRDNYTTMFNQIRKEMSKKLKGIQDFGGITMKLKITSPKELTMASLPNIGDLLTPPDGYRIIRKHSQNMATVILVAFGVGMQIHLYTSSYTTNQITKALTWTKIAVIDEEMKSLDNSKLKLVTQSLEVSLAKEIKSLTQRAKK
jgi:serine/threonine protein kinase